MEAKTKKTELALKQASSEVAAFVVDVKKEVAAIVEKFGSIVPMANTISGYEFCQQVRKEVQPIKVALDKARKQLKEPIIKAGKLVDAELNPEILKLEAVYKPFVSAYQNIDNQKKIAEAARQVKMEEAFEKMRLVVLESVGKPSLVIEALIDDFADFDMNPKVFMDRKDEAIGKYHEIMNTLSDSLIKAKEAEAQQEKYEEMLARESEMQKKQEEFERREAAHDKKLQDEADKKERQEQQRLDEIKHKKQDELTRAEIKAELIQESEAKPEIVDQFIEGYLKCLDDNKHLALGMDDFKSRSIAKFRIKINSDQK